MPPLVRCAAGAGAAATRAASACVQIVGARARGSARHPPQPLSTPLPHPQEEGPRNKKIIEDLVRRPENQFCADCGAKGACWGC